MNKIKIWNIKKKKKGLALTYEPWYKSTDYDSYSNIIQTLSSQGL
jgi:hypothetical protein